MRCLVVALLPAALSLMDDGAAFDGVAAFDDAVDPGALCLARGLAGPACLEVLGGVEDSVAACACFGGVMRAAAAADELTPLQQCAAAVRPRSARRCAEDAAEWLGTNVIDGAQLRGALCDVPLLRAIVRLRESLRGASALEIGGPSDLFEGAEGGRFAGFGLYPVVSRLDNVEFAQTTAWSVDDGGNARRRALYSASFVAEASTLVGVDSLYGAVLASHVLEHVADPISALRRWAARLEAAGLLVLVLPERRGTFDVYRNSTRLETLDDRCGRRAAEDDLSSLADVLGGLPLQGDDFERFARGALANAQSRTLHHSVFDLDLVRRLVENCVGGLRLVSEFVAEPFHLVAVYQRTADAQMPLLETHRQLDRTSCCLDLY
ncbi:hypothetical protein M885DRAFT_525603 [Pelagophyceae sp. CCMP2097]|nr:hypothetical protein M885DRAFT_525603 [Pelagophyceae sp. CCMP2097]|mmetsp:Transcript_33510/g.115269  ORF Transcript_33510/g.115269 Transcript_33510/m.115269 type:complete len:379 (+) Transcript_33510:190-1326(+)